MLNFILVLILFYVLYFLYRKNRLRNLKDIQNKTVLITGGCYGVGKEIIKILLKNKCSIINIDIRKEEFSKLEEFSKGIGGNIYNYECDLSFTENIDITFDLIFKKFEKIDIVINNAGVTFNKNFDKTSEIMIEKTIQINLLAPMKICKKVIEKSTNNSCHIVNMCSIMSQITVRKTIEYISSKWGLFGFHESLRYEYYDNSKLNFTIICPYAINTGMFNGFKTPIPL